jgi:hypothetical protein
VSSHFALPTDAVSFHFETPGKLTIIAHILVAFLEHLQENADATMIDEEIVVDREQDFHRGRIAQSGIITGRDSIRMPYTQSCFDLLHSLIEDTVDREKLSPTV